MKYYETPEFKKLDNKWKEKLHNSGFEDIEQPDGLLKIWSSHFFLVRHNGVNEEAKQEYYRLAGQFLYDHAFNNKKEKTAWELHSEGKSIDEITATMKKKRYKVYRSKVYEIIRGLADIMVAQCKNKT